MKTNYKIKDLVKNFYKIAKLFGLTKVFILGLLIIIIMILEVLSIGLIVPIISIIENENFVNKFSDYTFFLVDMTHLEQITFQTELGNGNSTGTL